MAEELTAKDALRTHLAEELGITDHTVARPVQAAVGSAAAFTIGSAVPLATAALSGNASRITVTIGVVVVSLAALGYAGARFGKATPGRPMARVVLGGIVAMAATMLVGKLFGTAVA